MKVLFFSAWYPHRYDLMSGLFVRKHAMAVSRYCDVCVLYLYADENVSDFEIVSQQTEKVTEVYVYYPFNKNNFLLKISKAINYWRAFKKGYKYVLKNFGKPDICQANVLTRSGALAYWLKLTQKIPYVVVEHWSRYLPQNFNYNGFLHKRMTERVVKNANCLMTVSQMLQNAMVAQGLNNRNTMRINNVVDDFFFERQEKLNRTRKRILHVSCFDEKAKNICGILRMVKRLSEKRSDFELIIVGTGIDYDDTVKYAKMLKLPDDVVRFVSEQTPQQVCDWMHQSDFFLMFSNYENAPVVLSESMAAGLPILSSNAGGIPEMITSETGVMVDAGDENALLEKTNWMLDNFSTFNKNTIVESAKKFSFEEVGLCLFKIYRQVLK